MDARSSRYHEVYARWQRDPQGFWGEAAAAIDWIEKPKTVFDPSAGVYGRWFVGGVCNTCFNAVDRHVDAGRGEQTAIIYDSPLAGQKRAITYHRLLTETQAEDVLRTWIATPFAGGRHQARVQKILDIERRYLK